MSHVHYKFSSKLSYDTVVFDDPNITLSDLKRQIMGREKLRAGDCDLQIVNAQTKEEYTDDQDSIPKGSSVIVRRIPFSGVKSGSSGKTHNTGRSDSHHNFGAFKAQMDNSTSSGALPFLSEMAILDNMDVSEEDKIKVLSQSVYDSTNYKKCGAGLPANYTCYRCGSTGHHIRNCPSIGQDKTSEAPLRIKRSTGIPRSFMVEVDDPGIKGAMLTNCGRYAIPAIDAKAYAVGKKEKPPFSQPEQPKSEGEDNPVPDELVCLICRDLLNDAVVIPCCGISYCDDCIRSALLDSEEHICPTCNQSEVSPDTLIANKFLRQAVNNYKKEQSYTKTVRRTPCPSQSQTTTPSPVPTPPPLYSQIQPQKLQQDPLLPCSEVTDPPSVSQEADAAPIVTGPVLASNTPSTFHQVEESHVESPDKSTHREADGGTQDAPAGSPSVLVSNTDSTSTPSQLIPLVSNPPVADQPQSVTVHPEPFSQSSCERQTDLLSTAETRGPAPAHSGQTACWESSSSASVCPSESWTKFSTQHLPSSSSTYSAAQSPLYPPVQFHTFLPAQQPLSSYPPGYPTTTPLWTLPTPRSAPIPSLCSSPSTSSIASLIPKEWFRHQRQKNERSPHSGSAYRHSSSHSKSSKYKSSRSYSRSSSRSRSRSRSQSRSRPPSPKTSHRDNTSRYHSSHSYSYNYKQSRSPTPSSSSTLRVRHRSRSRSPSGQRKSHHHSRHRSRRSSSRSSSSRKRGTHSSASGSSHRETGSSERSLDGYLQWKQEYKEWCDKYFNSYVGHFHQLPPPPPTPPPQPHWGKNSNYQPHSGPSSRRDGHSPASQWSSDSRSPPSQSPSESSSMSSQFSSDSRSTPSQTSNVSCSPPLRSCTDSYSVPSQEGAHLGANSSTKDRKEVEMQQSKGGKQVITNKQQNTGRDAYVDDSPAHEETTSYALQLDQPPLKTDKNLDKGYERKKKEKKTSDKERGLKRGKDFDSRRDMEKHYKVKSSQGAGSTDSDRNRRPRGSKTPDSKSERSRKRKGDDMQRNEREKILTEDHCRESLKTKLTEEPQTHESESPKRFDREKKKKGFWTAQPASEEDIWEGGIKVKPQKKISININLDGKRKQEDTEKYSQSSSERIEGKSQETTEDINHREEKEKLNRRETGLDVKARSDSVRKKKVVVERKIKPDGETRERLERAAFRDKKNEMWNSFVREEDDVGARKGTGEEEEVDLWHCALRGMNEEEKTVPSQGGEKRREEEEKKMEDDGRKTDTGDLPLTHQKERTNEDATGQQGRMNIEDEAPLSQSSRNYLDKLNTAVDNSRTSSSAGNSGGEHHQRTVTMVKSLKEYTESRAAELTQVPHSRCEKEESEGEQDNGETKAQAFPSPRPPVSVTLTDRETEGENVSKTQRLVELNRDRARAMERGEGVEKEAKSTLERYVAPSSGKYRTDSSFNINQKREERDRESSRKRQEESKSSKEKIREEDRRRDGERERSKSSTYSAHSSASTYNFTQILEEDRKKTLYEVRREKHQERNKSRENIRSSSYSASGGSRESHSISSAAELLSHNMHTTHRNLLLDLECKVKEGESKHPSHQSLHSLSYSQSMERGLLHFKTPREGSPDWESTHTPPKDQWKHRKQCLSSQDLSLERGEREKEERIRNESGGDRREWSPRKVDKVIKGTKQERKSGRTEAGGREEDGSSSSSSSPASLEDSKDYRGDEKKRQKTHTKEKRHPTSELEVERKSKDREEKESPGETDSWWKEEEDSVMFT